MDWKLKEPVVVSTVSRAGIICLVKLLGTAYNGHCFIADYVLTLMHVAKLKLFEIF